MRKFKTVETRIGLRLVCPYCNEVQNYSHGGILKNPPLHWVCQTPGCGRTFRVAAKWNPGPAIGLLLLGVSGYGSYCVFSWLWGLL